jgi:class 3 adenylate cyclase
MLITVDARNTGLSDRGVERVSTADRALDIDAVLDSLGIDECNLFGHGSNGPLAVLYAATRPERVRKLVLFNSASARRDTEQTPAIKALQAVLQYDWESFVEMLAGVALAWSEGSHTFARMLIASINQADLLRVMSRTEDVTSHLSGVKAPTLVVHNRDAVTTNAEAGRELAAMIPGARFVSLDGRSAAQAHADPRFRQALDEFLGGGVNKEPETGPLRTVLFTDLVGHTEMMSRLGDEEGRAVLREHERITREVLKASGGTEVKTMGDGFMASFGSVTKAVECAIALQRAFAEHEGEELLVRVGLNAGEPIEEDGDLFGATVILASRIAAKADGGEILVADTVRGLCSGKGFLFADRGEFVAKGFEEGVRVSEVRWQV